MLAQIWPVRGMRFETNSGKLVRSNIHEYRLRLSLRLPKIQPRPPCPPKIYQKLYKFLDATLLTGTRRSAVIRVSSRLDPNLRSSPANPKTPTKSKRSAHPAGTKRIAATQETIGERTTTTELTSKRKTPNKALPATKSTRNGVSRQRGAPIEPPQWTMPAIRRLCDKLNAPSVPHHVFAGVSSILALVLPDEIQIEAKLGSALKNIPVLIMVVFFAVYARLAAAETPVAVFMEHQATGFEILNSFAGSGAVENEKSQSEDFETLLLAMRQRGWAQMDWFENIKLGAGLELESPGGYGGDEDEIAPEQDSSSNLRDQYGEVNGQLQAGLGTMVRDLLTNYIELNSCVPDARTTRLSQREKTNSVPRMEKKNFEPNQRDGTSRGDKTFYKLNLHP